MRRRKKKLIKNKSSKSISINIVSENDNQDPRKDDLEQRREPSLRMTLGGYDEEDSEKKCYPSCWKPDLKTVGRCNLFLICFSVSAMAELILSFQRRKCYRLWCWQVISSTLPLPVISILIIDSYLIWINLFCRPFRQKQYVKCSR